MAWIKRNLFFTIGAVIALALLGVAGFYNFKNWSLNRETMTNLQAAYDQLQQDYNPTDIPLPGDDQVDNIKAVQDQVQQLRDWMDEAKKHFTPVPPIPNQANGAVTTEEFAGTLRRTIQELQLEATNLNVGLPPDYSFSFLAERNLVTFAPGSLNLLAQRLGEVKAICDLLFSSKINSLVGIQRESVSDNDAAGPQADYLPDKTVTAGPNGDLATETPYVVTFRCFSSDLATVLSSMASSDHCFIVKGINVIPAGATPGETDQNGPPPPPPMPMAGNGGLQTVLDEQLLQVTMAIEVVKLTK